jgi:two-component system response regulator VicR
MKKRILIVEDDSSLARVLSDSLLYCGFDVDWAANGNDGLARLREFSPDLVLLDAVLPEKSGFDLCGLIRKSGQTPVIMLTALDGKQDKLKGLVSGADDYVTKPFDFDELRERIRAVLRRARPTVELLRLGNITIDFKRLIATQGKRNVHLTHREFDILHYLAERQGSVVNRADLLRELWGYPEEPRTRSVDYAIIRLRRKIEADPHNPRHIRTVHGDGYCLTVDDHAMSDAQK